MFAHEKLQVYTKALDFSGRVSDWVAIWDKKHAIVDHMARATESILLNLAEAARQRDGPLRLQTIDYAIGSSLECAGCLDIGRIKNLLTQERCHGEKAQLAEITRMLIGLRRSWDGSSLSEEQSEYKASCRQNRTEILFHHENLDVYQAALNFMEWFVSTREGESLSNKSFRQIDDAGTSIVLNIAEGNGRYAALDHRRFLDIAQRGAAKAVVYLDLCTRSGILVEKAAMTGKDLLRRISAMISRF